VICLQVSCLRECKMVTRLYYSQFQHSSLGGLYLFRHSDTKTWVWVVSTPIMTHKGDNKIQIASEPMLTLHAKHVINIEELFSGGKSTTYIRQWLIMLQGNKEYVRMRNLSTPSCQGVPAQNTSLTLSRTRSRLLAH